MKISVLIPAHDEVAYIGACLDALFASDPVQAEAIVIANGCTDDTAAVARSYEDVGLRAGWTLQVIDTPQGGKLNALNVGEAAAGGRVLAYLDADVIVTAPLISQIADALDTDAPAYAGGTPRVAQARTGITRAYARFWQTLPFVLQGVPGFGIYAVNRAGRARWGNWPDIISDDTFVRLNFAPSERIRVAATYSWPMVEGFANLVRVRRRQDRGVREIATDYPALIRNNDPEVSGPSVLRRFIGDPAGFVVYASVAVATRLPILRSKSLWARGR